MRLPSDATLLVIDVKSGAMTPEHSSPEAEVYIGYLVDVWRTQSLALVHVDGEASETVAELETARGAKERNLTRLASSAFVGTDLEERLTAGGVTTLVVCGLETDRGVEATVRHAADLGYRVFVVADACAAGGRQALDGSQCKAADVHALALARMADVGATIVDARTAWSAAKTAGWGRR